MLEELHGIIFVKKAARVIVCDCIFHRVREGIVTYIVEEAGKPVKLNLLIAKRLVRAVSQILQDETRNMANAD